MALKQIRIGDNTDLFQYDDGSHSEAIDTDDEPIKIGASVAGEHAIRQDQLPATGDVVSASANIGDNEVVRGDGGAKGIQGSNISVTDGGSITLPAGQTVDGMDPSAHAADVSAHHTKYTDAEARTSINDIFGSDGKADKDIDLDAQVLKQSGTQVVGSQQAAEADLAVVPDLTGANTVDQSGLETYLGDIRTTLNSLLAKLRTHGLIDT